MKSTTILQWGRSGPDVAAAVADAGDGILFVGDSRYPLDIAESALRRMIEVAEAAGAGLVYADSVGRPRIDYQPGGIRDDFDFGPIVAVAAGRAREAFARHGAPDRDIRWGGFYDLRLKLSLEAPIVRIPEPLYAAEDPDRRTSGERQFDYVDPAARDYQLEMERIATAHLRRLGAHLEPPAAKPEAAAAAFPLDASVVIPVRNRAATIRDAVQSALSQQTGLRFNVIVVDNHSTDGTGEAVDAIGDARVVRLVPARTDLGIGGCWNEAVYSDRCGRIAVQLDSDDLFEDVSVLERIVGAMARDGYAMLVGAYTTVDFGLNAIPPGLVAHREWTRENGHNNILRINGFGAPRAYDVAVIRRFGFPNVSYGEDYAMGLRVCREYEIGRIYDSLYLCRRWEGNTDSALPVEALNRFNAYKDWLRTTEIRARIRANLARAGARDSRP